MDRSYLEELDNLRFSDPERSAELAAEALPKVVPSDRPLCLGVYGSARRVLGDLPTARLAIEEGLRAAYRADDWWTTANLTARLGYVVGDEGNWQDAASLAAQAACMYLCAANKEGVGRSLVDRGRALYYLDQPAEALACHKTALTLLASDSHRNRYSAMVGAGLAACEMGRLETAHGFLTEAAEPAESLGPALKATLLGLVAEIEEQRGHLQAAEAAFRSAADIFFPLSPTDSALAMVRQIGLIIAQGELERARERVDDLIPYLEACRRSKAIAGSIMTLIRARDSLDAQLVQRVAKVISNHAAKAAGSGAR